MKFRTTIVQNGNNTGIAVPEDVLHALGGGKRPAVTVTIGGFSYASTVGVMGGNFLIPLSAARRTESGLSGGQEVEVEIVLDAAPRTVEVPDDLQAALAGEPVALAAFGALSNSARSRHVLPILDAKTPETRQRRIAKVLENLLAEKS